MKKKALLGAVLAVAFAAVCAMPAFATEPPKTYDVEVDNIGASVDWHWYFDNQDNSMSANGEGQYVTGATNYAAYVASENKLYLKGNIKISSYGFKFCTENMTVVVSGDVKVYCDDTFAFAGRETEGDLFNMPHSCTSLLITSTDGGSLTLEADKAPGTGWCIKPIYSESVGGTITISDLSSFTAITKKYDAGEDGSAISSDADITFKNIANVNISCPTAITEVGPSLNPISMDGATLTFDNCKKVSISSGTTKSDDGGNAGIQANKVVLKSSNVSVKVGSSLDNLDSGFCAWTSMTMDAKSSLYATASFNAIGVGAFDLDSALVVKGSTQANVENPADDATCEKRSELYSCYIGTDIAKTIYIYNPTKPADDKDEPLPKAGDSTPFAGIAALALVATAAVVVARRRMA